MVNSNHKTNGAQTCKEEGVITTTTCKIWLDDDGITRAVMFPGAEENLETAKENVAAGIAVSGGKRRPLFLDMSKIKSMNRDARDFYARENKREGSEKVAALVIKSPISRILGNFFLGLNKSTTPTRLFTDEDKAIEWLKTFLD